MSKKFRVSNFGDAAYTLVRLICCVLNFLKANFSGAAYLPEITVNPENKN